SSASAHQRRGSGVFTASPLVRGADLITGLPLVSMRPPCRRFQGVLVETPATPERERQPLRHKRPPWPTARGQLVGEVSSTLAKPVIVLPAPPGSSTAAQYSCAVTPRDNQRRKRLS